MKNKGIILALVLVAAGTFLVMSGKSGDTGSESSSSSTASKAGTGSSATGNSTVPGSGGQTAGGDDYDDDDLDDFDFDVQAADKYANAQEALAALKKGAEDYDDFIIQQFVQPGDNCSWCPELYNNLRNMVLDSSVGIDERGYYAEILAISGKPENIAHLVDSIQNATSEEDRDMLAESLELAIGGDEMLQYLAGHMNSSSEILQEAVVAAVSNQGSRLAAELLYNNAVEIDDPDGFYSYGIGLGELVPDNETLPYLQEIVQKRDKFSHLAVKSLLNSGLPGLTIVFNTLTNNPQEGDRALLEDASDHLFYESETKAYLEKMVKESNVPLLQEFAKEILEEFADEEDDYDDYDDYE